MKSKYLIIPLIALSAIVCNGRKEQTDPYMAKNSVRELTQGEYPVGIMLGYFGTYVKGEDGNEGVRLQEILGSGTFKAFDQDNDGDLDGVSCTAHVCGEVEERLGVELDEGLEESVNVFDPLLDEARERAEGK